ncbi:MAG: hypothetical protein U5K69_07535 [Balneolaceae bacterium]|nr:hypothetical protein [Balneolaceae bacterium]
MKVLPYPGLGMLGEEQEAKKEVGIPVRSSDGQQARRTMSKLRPEARSGVQHSPALMVESLLYQDKRDTS